MGDNLSVSLHIEAYVLAIGTQHAPADEDTLAGSRQCHHATIEFLHCSYRWTILFLAGLRRHTSHQETSRRNQQMLEFYHNLHS